MQLAGADDAETFPKRTEGAQNNRFHNASLELCAGTVLTPDANGRVCKAVKKKPRTLELSR